MSKQTFFLCTSGDPLSRLEAKQHAVSAIRELEAQTARARQALSQLMAGEPMTDGFLSFDGVLENGYDRTGPEEVAADSDEPRPDPDCL